MARVDAVRSVLPAPSHLSVSRRASVNSPLLTTLALIAAVLPGCDLVGGHDRLDEGQRLRVIEYGEQPGSRAEYARLATLVIPGAVVVLDPGEGGAPRVVRSIRIPDHLTSDAQLDRDGYLWVATPDRNSVPLRIAYVLDPSTGTVVRAIELPQDLRSVAALVVGRDRVFLRSWRDGFSGAVGAVDRRCATVSSACEPTVLTELGNVGTSSENAFILDGDTLFSFSNPNSRDEREAVDRIDTRTGKITATAPYGGKSVADDDFIYAVAFFEPGVNSIVKLDKATLGVVDQLVVGPEPALLALQDGVLYDTGFRDDVVRVRSTETLEVEREIDVSSTRGATAAFGFLAPDVLVLSHAAYLDLGTETIGEFPVEAMFSQSLRLAE